MPRNGRRLLALDGGGVRGLSSLMILERPMESVDPDSPPKPCDYFDMIGGTSTGGLIAIMLGRLKMSIDECIEAYLSLSARVFEKKGHRVSINLKLQGRLDSNELANVIKETVSKQGLEEDALLKDDADAKCKVFVCAMSKRTSDIVCLASYKSPHYPSAMLRGLKIWEACRATSAASTFFDPISIGRFGEEFLDCATGANNPVQELWNQAQAIWGPLESGDGVELVVSIGTGIPSLEPFRDDARGIGKSLTAISTETEKTAERFQRDKSSLDEAGRYFRFNVVSGLENIGLEESTKQMEITAATDRYLGSQDVVKRMKACTSSIAPQAKNKNFKVEFSLKGVPVTREFIDRQEMLPLEEALLPSNRKQRRRIYVLRGLGGIGKTQLAVEFARRHHEKFTAVFWLDGSSEDSLKHSILQSASRLPPNRISEAKRSDLLNSQDKDIIIDEVLDWLAQRNNKGWLIIFDNVDREHDSKSSDPQAYDIKRYIPSADHGSILVTTRLGRLEQLGKSQDVTKVNHQVAQAIFKSWYTTSCDSLASERLLEILDGLPLAIAQAGAYLQQTGDGIETYLECYRTRWQEIPKSVDAGDKPLDDYANGSISTTWAISYHHVYRKARGSAHLLLLWAFLDNKDIWFDLFQCVPRDSSIALALKEWLGDIASEKLAFSQAMALLRSYSLIEHVEKADSYVLHPVIHRWAYNFGAQHYRTKLGLLAVAIVGSAVPKLFEPGLNELRRRLLPHAQACSCIALEIDRIDLERDRITLEMDQKIATMRSETGESLTATEILEALNGIGKLYSDCDKLNEAEMIYQLAIDCSRHVLGEEHLMTHKITSDRGIVYAQQDALSSAAGDFRWALRGFMQTLTSTDTLVLST